MARINIADANGRDVGFTGYNWLYGGVALESDPTSGIVYGSSAYDLFIVSLPDGVAAWHAAIQPTGVCALGLAINSNGQAFATCTIPFGQKLLRVDLATGMTVELGVLTGLGPGLFRDMAFRSNGELWGIYLDTGAPFDRDGIYVIDIQSVTATPVLLTPHNGTPRFAGLAFVPEPAVTSYCTAKTNSLGCVPTIGGEGWPTQSASSGFEIVANAIRNQTMGILFYGTSGRAAVPFAGGTLCIGGALSRTAPTSSGGSPSPTLDCSGQWSLDFNAWLYAKPALPAGTMINAQWYGRDPGFAWPQSVSLSDALEFALLP